MCTFLSWSTFLPVGYDSEHMNLSGRYSYHRLAHIFKCKSVVDYQIKIWDPGKTFQIKICNPGKTNVRCPSMWTSRTCLHIRESLLEVQVGFMISRHCWWSCIVHPIQATTVLTGLRFFSADHSAPSSSPSTSPPPCLSWWAGSPSSSHLWASPSFSTYLYPFTTIATCDCTDINLRLKGEPAAI